MINILRGFSGVAIAAALAALMLAPEAFAQTSGKTIKFIPEADLRSLDPIWTTAYITRNHGYMVYDTLFALDEHFKPQPQMVDHWKISDDKLIYTFTLRDKLKFHDGQPVRSADCIASLQRWMKRDALGQAMAESVGEMKAEDDSTFSIILKKPFPLLLEAIGKLSSNVPFIMPERVAKTDAGTQITDPTGSGPFKFVKEEWVPGNKAIYVKNADYVPRSEPPSWASGGKVVKVDRDLRPLHQIALGSPRRQIEVRAMRILADLIEIEIDPCGRQMGVGSLRGPDGRHGRTRDIGLDRRLQRPLQGRGDRRDGAEVAHADLSRCLR